MDDKTKNVDFYGFKSVAPAELGDNFFTRLSKDWMLITVDDEENQKVNAMTASWGGIGHLWSKDIAICFIRPQRHTFPLMEREDYYTLSFFDSGKKEYRKALNFCGSKSGKDYDKVKETALTPKKFLLSKDVTVPVFEESNLILVCKKIYRDEFKPEFFFDETIDSNYPLKDYHKIYIGEILTALVK